MEMSAGALRLRFAREGRQRAALCLMRLPLRLLPAR